MRLIGIPAVATTAIVLGCGGGGAEPPVGLIPTSIDHVAMSVPTATVEVGSQVTLSAKGVALDGSPVSGTVAWSTGSESIATVTQSGVVTGVAPGTTNITATVSGKSGHTVVTVVANGLTAIADYTDVTIAPTAWTTCARTSANGVRCWGMNAVGQLGDGTTVDRSTPVQVATTLAFTEIASGNGQTCGITASGDLYCWGNLSFVGGSVDRSATPRSIPGSVSYSEISIGESNACARVVGGAAYCWGGNQYGAVGDGTRNDRTTPVAVLGSRSYEQITVGGDFACGRMSSGDAYCWGRNDVGQLGNGTTIDQLVPVPVSGGIQFSAISASVNYACALTKAGAIYCWGNNFGVVSGPGRGGQAIVPTLVLATLDTTDKFIEVATGLFHACALTMKGAAWCWGNNEHGELGDGSTATRTRPAAVTGGLTFTKIAAGHWYTCGVTASGAIYCWGYNGFGNLGDGTMETRTEPTLVR